jgi:hypothetical protein
MLPVHSARRYVTPLREGGSLPALVETSGGAFAVKFRGAGQGARALVAEAIVGPMARLLGLPAPDVALVDLDAAFGRAEPDPEIQDILRASRGLNVGLRWIEGAFAYDGLAHSDLVSPRLASHIVWLDALTTNIDRTPRNPNLLVAPSADGPQVWLIDHGAALYFHHDWAGTDAERMRTPFAAIKDHILLPLAAEIAQADARLAPLLSREVLTSLLADVPDELLMHAPEGRTPPFETAQAARAAYLDYFATRLSEPRAWVAEAVRAHSAAPDLSEKAYRR